MVGGKALSGAAGGGADGGVTRMLMLAGVMPAALRGETRARGVGVLAILLRGSNLFANTARSQSVGITRNLFANTSWVRGYHSDPLLGFNPCQHGAST